MADGEHPSAKELNLCMEEKEREGPFYRRGGRMALAKSLTPGVCHPVFFLCSADLIFRYAPPLSCEQK
jgi:hypothetical protein